MRSTASGYKADSVYERNNSYKTGYTKSKVYGERTGALRKKGWILLLILLCVAFLISCAGNKEEEREKAELVRIEKIWKGSAFLIYPVIYL